MCDSAGWRMYSVHGRQGTHSPRCLHGPSPFVLAAIAYFPKASAPKTRIY